MASQQFWIINKSKSPFNIVGPKSRKCITDTIEWDDYHLAVVGCDIDVKCQFSPDQLGDLHKQLGGDSRITGDILPTAIWRLITGRKKVSLKKVSPKPRKAASRADSVELDALYRDAAEIMGTTEKNLRDRYEHLGVGLQSMNLRNRIRHCKLLKG